MDEEPAPVNTVHDSFIDALRLNPTYNTSVSINRTTTKWDQGFNIKRDAERIKASNSWSVRIEKNSAQNDYRSRFGSAKARLEYDLPGLGGWSAGTELEMRRNFAGSRFDRTVANGANVNLFVTSELPGRALARSFGLPANAVSWSVTGSAGLTDETDIRQRWTLSQVTQNLGKTSDDSTHATGSAPVVESQLKLASGAVWKCDVTSRYNWSREDSRTVSYKPSSAGSPRPQALEVQKQPNRDRGQRFSLNSLWAFDPKNQISVSAQYTKAVTQYYQNYVDRQGQETKNGLSQNLGLQVKVEPFWGIGLDLRGGSTLTDLVYELSNQDQRRRDNVGEVGISFKTGPSLGWLQRIESTTEWSIQETRNDAENTADYTQKERHVKQVFRRPIGSRVVLLTTAEGRLTQSFYDDPSSDRDDVSWLLDGAVGYRPIPVLDTKLRAQYQQRKTVNIAAVRSINNNTQNTYKVEAEVNYQVTPSVRATQRYTMTADYSTYDFNENSNGLVRTTEVRTNINSTVGSKVNLTLEHSYRFKDNGSYLRSATTGIRAYSKRQEETFQYMTIATRYQFSDEFNIHSSERLEARRTAQVVGNTTPNVVRRFEFQGGLELNHKFSEEFTINSRIDQVRSSSEDDYWLISASLNRRF